MPELPIETRVFDLGAVGPTERHVWDLGFAIRLTLDGTKIQVDLKEGKSRVLRWDDPELEFSIVDWRGPVARGDKWKAPKQAFKTPFALQPQPWNTVFDATFVWVPQEAAQALVDAATAAHLSVYEGGLPKGAPYDLEIGIFTRRKHLFRFKGALG